MILYRPVGTKELELIKESGYKKFSPRLSEQVIIRSCGFRQKNWMNVIDTFSERFK